MTRAECPSCGKPRPTAGLSYDRAHTAMASIFLGLEGIGEELRMIEQVVANIRRGLEISRRQYETWREALRREEAL